MGRRDTTPRLVGWILGVAIAVAAIGCRSERREELTGSSSAALVPQKRVMGSGGEMVTCGLLPFTSGSSHAELDFSVRLGEPPKGHHDAKSHPNDAKSRTLEKGAKGRDEDDRAERRHDGEDDDDAEERCRDERPDHGTRGEGATLSFRRRSTWTRRAERPSGASR
jgi:hypothetical protein